MTKGRRLLTSYSVFCTGHAPALIAVLFAVLMAIFLPLGQRQEFHPDEGLNLIKGFLMARGLPLYREIWADQPPLFSLLLSWVIRFFGNSLWACRALSVGFSAVLIWALGAAVSTTVSPRAAPLACFLLIMSPGFWKFSATIGIGLPSISVAMVSIVLLIRSLSEGSRRYLVLSALCFSLSLQLKLMGALLLPAGLAAAIFTGRPTRASVSRAAVWFSLIAITFGLGMLLQGAVSMEQLLDVHFPANPRETFNGSFSFEHLRTIRKDTQLFFPAAAIGAFLALSNRARFGLLPVSLLVTALAFFFLYYPIWITHEVFFLVPLIWCVSYSFEAVFRSFDSGSAREGKRMTLWLVRGAVLLAIVRVAQEEHECFRVMPEFYTDTSAISALSSRRGGPEEWVFTDRPFYAFVAGVPSVPPLAVLSWKRLHSQTWNDEFLMKTLKRYNPKHVLVGRFRLEEFGVPFLRFVEENYRLEYEHKGTSYYLRKTEDR